MLRVRNVIDRQLAGELSEPMCANTTPKPTKMRDCIK
jgi:hypothetical protein